MSMRFAFSSVPARETAKVSTCQNQLGDYAVYQELATKVDSNWGRLCRALAIMDLDKCWDLRSSRVALSNSRSKPALLFDHAFQGNFPRPAMRWWSAPCGSPCHLISFHLHFNVN